MFQKEADQRTQSLKISKTILYPASYLKSERSGPFLAGVNQNHSGRSSVGWYVDVFSNLLTKYLGQNGTKSALFASEAAGQYYEFGAAAFTGRAALLDQLLLAWNSHHKLLSGSMVPKMEKV